MPLYTYSYIASAQIPVWYVVHHKVIHHIVRLSLHPLASHRMYDHTVCYQTHQHH